MAFWIYLIVCYVSGVIGIRCCRAYHPDDPDLSHSVLVVWLWTFSPLVPPLAAIFLVALSAYCVLCVLIGLPIRPPKSPTYEELLDLDHERFEQLGHDYRTLQGWM